MAELAGAREESTKSPVVLVLVLVFSVSGERVAVKKMLQECHRNVSLRRTGLFQVCDIVVRVFRVVGGCSQIMPAKN